MNWYDILTATGVLTSFQIIILLILGYFFRTKFEDRLNRSIETYKNELRKELDIHKHELDKLQASYEIRFGKFFDKKANALADLFESLTNLKFAMRAYLSKLKISPVGKSFEEFEKEQEEFARNSYNSFIKIFHQKRIFVSKDLCVKIDALLDSYNECYRFYSVHMGLKGDRDIDRNLRAQTWSDFTNALDKMDNEIPKTLEEIEDSFRKDYV